MTFTTLTLLAILTAPAYAANKDVDADRDGIADSLDKCPLTPGNSTVNAYGCRAGERVVISVNVIFATDSVVVNQEYRQQVFALADFLKRHPDIKVELKGYADKEGESDYNRGLSTRRADAIREMLVKDYKIKAERVSTAGRGESSWAAPHSGTEGNYRNRRVEAYVIQ